MSHSISAMIGATLAALMLMPIINLKYSAAVIAGVALAWNVALAIDSVSAARPSKKEE